MVDARQPVVDVLLDAPASVSIYQAALLRAGRTSEVTLVERAHADAADLAAAELHRLAAWSARSEPGVPLPHTYEQADVRIEKVTHALPEHHGLHAHLILGGVDVVGVRRALPSIASRYTRTLLDGLVDRLGLGLADTSGTAQIAGVPDDLVTTFEPAPCRLRAGTSQLRASPGRRVTGTGGLAHLGLM